MKPSHSFQVLLSTMCQALKWTGVVPILCFSESSWPSPQSRSSSHLVRRRMLLLPSICWFCICGFSQLWIENIKKKIPETPLKQKLEFAVYQQLFGLPRWRQCKEPACQCECRIRGLGSIPGWEGSPGEGNGSPLQYSCLAGCSPLDRKELDTTGAT